jgi:hypothetical protein
MNRGVTYIAFIVVLSLAAASCSLEGKFGFKRFGEDTYRRTSETPEFASNEAVDWVYVFSKKYGERQIGVVYRKKELVWVEMLTRVSKIDETNKVVYGTIKNLPPGHYQIVLTDLQNNNGFIDSKDFIIYEKENDEED